MLKINPGDYSEIRKHGEETYPHECCGVLLGQMAGDVRTVTSTARCGNTRTDSPQNRYHIDPKELVRIQREARGREEDIVGFYHSHPDHPARPSQYDLDHAWPSFSYVIVSVMSGEPADLRSWKLKEDRSAFDEEPIVNPHSTTVNR